MLAKKRELSVFEVPPPPLLLAFPGVDDRCLPAGSLSTFLGLPLCPGFLLFVNIVFTERCLPRMRAA